MNFEKFLVDNNLKIIKELYINQKKKQYSYLLRDISGNFVFCKIKEDLDSKGKSHLENEANFFRKYPNQNFSPKMIANYDDEIILYQYFKSISLKSHFDSLKIKPNAKIPEEFKILISNLIQILKKLNEFSSSPKFSELIFRKKMKQHWYNLINSGPLGYKTRKIESFAKKTISMLFKPSFLTPPKIKFHKNRNSSQYDGNITHGDLHLNNIIVSTDKKQIKIIDWENWEESFFFTDLIYISSILLIYFEGFKLYQDYIKKMFYTWIYRDFPEYLKSYIEFSNKFYTFGKINRNFYKNSKNCKFFRFSINAISFSFLGY